MRVILDTNVFISGIFWSGRSEEVLFRWFREEFEVVVSIEIFSEIVRVLESFKIPLPIEELDTWKKIIIQKSVMVTPKKTIRLVKDDPSDDKFIEAAIEAKARYIVTQDSHLLKIGAYEGVNMLCPDEFLTVLKKIEHLPK